MKSFMMQLKIESILMVRSIDSIFFGIGFPIVVALFMGILIKDQQALDETFSAISTIGICATGLMGLPLTISDYRHRKILKRYSVTPISPWRILMAQFIINFVVALLSLVAVFFVMTFIFQFNFKGNLVLFLLAFTLNVFAMYGFGMMIASVSPTVKTSNLLCTLIYFPMIFLSGTVVPYSVMPEVVQHIMDFSPLKIGIDLMNHYAIGATIDVVMPVACLIIIGIICTFISTKCFKWM